MKRGVISLLAVLLLMPGCSTYIRNHQIAKQHEFNYKYPNETAKDCARLFPVKDSVGEPIFTPANNIDQSGKVDSVKKEADSVKAVLKLLIGLPNDTAKLRRTIVLLNAKVNTLSNKINALQASYKPCKSDTFHTAPIYRQDMALVTFLRNQITIKADSLRDNKVKLATETKKADKYCLRFWLENGFFILIIIVVAVWKVYGLFNGTAEVKAGANILNYFKKK